MKQKGFSLIELLIVVAIILIIAAIAIPNLLRSRIAANEASAVGSLRTMNTGMITYASTYPATSFPDALLSLQPVVGGGNPSPVQADVLDSVLSGAAAMPVMKSGFQFAYNPGAVTIGLPPTQPPGRVTYGIDAWPISQNTSGIRVFATTQAGVVYDCGPGGAAIYGGTGALPPVAPCVAIQ